MSGLYNLWSRNLDDLGHLHYLLGLDENLGWNLDEGENFMRSDLGDMLLLGISKFLAFSFLALEMLITLLLCMLVMLRLISDLGSFTCMAISC